MQKHLRRPGVAYRSALSKVPEDSWHLSIRSEAQLYLASPVLCALRLVRVEHVVPTHSLSSPWAATSNPATSDEHLWRFVDQFIPGSWVRHNALLSRQGCLPYVSQFVRVHHQPDIPVLSPVPEGLHLPQGDGACTAILRVMWRALKSIAIRFRPYCEFAV